MSLKMRSLGTMSSAARGILITGGTNATPIVATITAGHRLKNGDRIGIVGVTTLTAMNGDWTASAVAATTVTLGPPEISAGNGAFGGTAVVAVVCDKTPFLPRHSAIALLTQPSGAVFVGTVVYEYADSHKSDETNFQYTNSSGVATDGFNSALLSGEIAIPAATAGQIIGVEVALGRYMTARCSAYTSGVAQGQLIA
jgi:hypothetical protein